MCSFGKLCVRGHRILVSLVPGLLATGMAKREILKDYPGCEPEDIQTCIAYGTEMPGERVIPVRSVPRCARLGSRARPGYVPDMSTQEILLEEIKRQPEPVLIEVWHYLKFLTRQREEEAGADVLPSRQVEQEVLDHLGSK